MNTEKKKENQMSEEVSKIHIKKWNNHHSIPGSVVVCFGKRNSGKTVLLKDLCRYMKGHVDVGLLFSPTQSTRDLFKSFFPEVFISTTFPDMSLIVLGPKKGNIK